MPVRNGRCYRVNQRELGLAHNRNAAANDTLESYVSGVKRITAGRFLQFFRGG